MSRDEFRERLERISNQRANTAIQVERPVEGPSRGRRLLAFLASLILSGFSGVLTYYSEKNDAALRAAGDVGLANGIKVGSFALFALGAVLFLWSIWPRRGAVPSTGANKGSKIAQGFALVFGLSFGVFICLGYFVAAAARVADPNPENLASGIASLAATLALTVAFLMGMAGVLLRFRSLSRIPLYLGAGFICTYGVFRFLRINLLEWPTFMAFVQQAAP